MESHVVSGYNTYGSLFFYAGYGNNSRQYQNASRSGEAVSAGEPGVQLPGQEVLRALPRAGRALEGNEGERD
eukprot:CAMPEP_0113950618 /NCGR_PEP_ID=MMETSP1339-20121228/81750_1 /TAXON_ID=94617 /ORGANISM="Fibrocapsa japonica" /LENGTH=71 /DNA_ID=CAMNT_0000958517 /DNA_START=92 /DNA_END=304 /DNA_ORIENTATION=- /assembly_acc=CAM_ASM_000762